MPLCEQRGLFPCARRGAAFGSGRGLPCKVQNAQQLRDVQLRTVLIQYSRGEYSPTCRASARLRLTNGCVNVRARATEELVHVGHRGRERTERWRK